MPHSATPLPPVPHSHALPPLPPAFEGATTRKVFPCNPQGPAGHYCCGDRPGLAWQGAASRSWWLRCRPGAAARGRRGAYIFQATFSWGTRTRTVVKTLPIHLGSDPDPDRQACPYRLAWLGSGSAAKGRGMVCSSSPRRPAGLALGCGTSLRLHCQNPSPPPSPPSGALVGSADTRGPSSARVRVHSYTGASSAADTAPANEKRRKR